MSTVTAEAGRRIRRFTLGVGVLAVVAALGTLASLVVPQLLREAAGVRDRPWTAETVVEAERESDIVWASKVSARIALPAELRDRPIELRLVSETSGMVAAYLGDVGSAERSPAFLGSVTRNPLPIAAYADSELWITAAAPWRVEIRPIEPAVLESIAHGDGLAVLVARGDAATGVVRWSGDGSLYVVARTVDGYESLASNSGEETGGQRRFVWQDSPFVVIEVSVYGEVEWSIELDGTSPPAPTPDAGGAS